MEFKNPWAQNPWFESVAVAQRRAQKRLPKPVYGALVAGSERGQTIDDNEAAFRALGFAPHVAGHHAERQLATSVFGQDDLAAGDHLARPGSRPCTPTARWRWPAPRRPGAR